MITEVPELKRIAPKSNTWARQRPIPFDDFLDMFGKTDFVELVDGMVLERPMVNWDHEKLNIWLVNILNMIAEELDLGEVAGSRTAIKLDMFGVRIPDVLFVKRSREHIIEFKAIIGAPDLIIEIVSASNRRDRLITLEADYCRLGVNEIIFIDPKRKNVRVLTKSGSRYTEQIVTEGPINITSFNGLELDTSWLLTNTRPTIHYTAELLLKQLRKDTPAS